MSAGLVAEEWAAWEARCTVSHAGHFGSLRNPAIAFHRVSKPLRDLRVALISSGGIYVQGSQPFDLISHAGDDSIRWIPGDVRTAELRFAHDHYDLTDPEADPNCIFPIDRLRELAAERVIQSVAQWHVGFMGWIPDPRRFARDSVPSIVARLTADRVDAVVLSPEDPVGHRSIALVQNALEDVGIATVSITMVPYISIMTGVPRTLHVRLPYGNPFGEPGDVRGQREILGATLQWLYDAPGPNQLFDLRVPWRRSRRQPAAEPGV
jgi:D-proline reductase (dithiol) PrdB